MSPKDNKKRDWQHFLYKKWSLLNCLDIPLKLILNNTHLEENQFNLLCNIYNCKTSYLKFRKLKITLHLWSPYNERQGIPNPSFSYLSLACYLDLVQYWSLLNWQKLRLHCGCVAVPVNWFFDIISSFFAKKNVVHSLESGETPSNSASHQASNYVQRS